MVTLLCFLIWDVYVYYFLKEYFPGINNEPYFTTLLTAMPRNLEVFKFHIIKHMSEYSQP